MSPVPVKPRRARQLERLALGALIGGTVGLFAALMLWAQFYEEYGGRITTSDWVLAAAPAVLLALGIARPRLRDLAVGALLAYGAVVFLMINTVI